MAYDDKLKETQQETFAELYKFTVGETTTFYTSYRQQQTYQGDIYLPRAIKRSDFKYQKKLRSVKVTVSAPLDPLGLSYVANAPAEAVIIEIIRVFLDGSEDSAAIFNGEVISVTLKDLVANAEVESSVALFRNKTPKVVYQSACNWMVFSEECGLDSDLFQTLTTVTVSGFTLVSPDFALQADGYFTMGHVEKDGDFRLITNHVGDTITLQVPFDDRLQTGGTVKAFPGCDGHYLTCQNKFNNYGKFFGFVGIPKTNPVIWGMKSD